MSGDKIVYRNWPYTVDEDYTSGRLATIFTLALCISLMVSKNVLYGAYGDQILKAAIAEKSLSLMEVIHNQFWLSSNVFDNLRQR